MPGGQVSCEEESRKCNRQQQRLARPMNRLPEGSGEQPQEGKRERQPPEAGGDRADAAVPHQERTAGQREIADQQGDESQAFDFAFVGAHPAPLAAARQLGKN